MKRLTIWLTILSALIALAAIFDRGHPLFALILVTASLGLLVALFLSRPKSIWLGGVLGAAAGAALGWWFGRGLDALIPLSIGVGVLGLILYAFLSAVKNTGKAYTGSSSRDGGFDGISGSGGGASSGF